jgi:ABC-type multidrug transport system ATPase subunit
VLTICSNDAMYHGAPKTLYFQLNRSLSVLQHLQFYAQNCGLDWESEEAKDHGHVIVHLLGLGPHVEKLATKLLCGYKHRLSLAI